MVKDQELNSNLVCSTG